MGEEYDEYEKVVDEANIGADLAAFKNGNVGRYLIARADELELRALRKLATIPAGDKEEIYKLQLEAAVPRRFIQFVDEAITRGKAARWQLDQHSDD